MHRAFTNYWTFVFFVVVGLFFHCNCLVKAAYVLYAWTGKARYEFHELTRPIPRWSNVLRCVVHFVRCNLANVGENSLHIPKTLVSQILTPIYCCLVQWAMVLCRAKSSHSIIIPSISRCAVAFNAEETSQSILLPCLSRLTHLISQPHSSFNLMATYRILRRKTNCLSSKPTCAHNCHDDSLNKFQLDSGTLQQAW